MNSGSYFGELSIIREQVSRAPISVSYSEYSLEYSLEYSTNIPCQQSSKSVSDCRLRGLLHTDVKPLLSRYATGESSPLERSTLLPPNDQMSMYRRRENAGGDESCPFLSPWDASRHLHHLRCHLTTDSSVDSFVDRLLTAAAARLVC